MTTEITLIRGDDDDEKDGDEIDDKTQIILQFKRKVENKISITFIGKEKKNQYECEKERERERRNEKCVRK